MSDKESALQRWVERVVLDKEGEKRRHPRWPVNEEITIIPLAEGADGPVYEPEPEQVVSGRIRDHSVGGIGIQAYDPLTGDVFVVEIISSGLIFLCRKVWDREAPKGVHNYGLQTLDFFRSFDELLENLEE